MNMIYVRINLDKICSGTFNMIAALFSIDIKVDGNAPVFNVFMFFYYYITDL